MILPLQKVAEFLMESMFSEQIIFRLVQSPPGHRKAERTEQRAESAVFPSACSVCTSDFARGEALGSTGSGAQDSRPASDAL